MTGVVVLLEVGGEQNLLVTLGGHQLCFFVIAMACHGELARTRPAAKYLTGFYVALSFGGMIGGLFAGLIAPYTFSWIAEYPILLALAALCRPQGGNERFPRWSSWYWPFLAGLAFALIAPSWSGGEAARWPVEHRVWVAGAVGALSAMLARGPNRSRWKFFEIDQTMVDTARDPKYFTYIQGCEPDLKPVIGDARLTFAREPDGIYDLIIVDAYSSDAIPVHLATQQAMAIYKSKLAPQGAVGVHVSNRHLELSSVIAGIAEANNLRSWVYSDDCGRDDDYIFATPRVVDARAEYVVGHL